MATKKTTGGKKRGPYPTTKGGGKGAWKGGGKKGGGKGGAKKK